MYKRRGAKSECPTCHSVIQTEQRRRAHLLDNWRALWPCPCAAHAMFWRGETLKDRRSRWKLMRCSPHDTRWRRITYRAHRRREGICPLPSNGTRPACQRRRPRQLACSRRWPSLSLCAHGTACLEAPRVVHMGADRVLTLDAPLEWSTLNVLRDALARAWAEDRARLVDQVGCRQIVMRVHWRVALDKLDACWAHALTALRAKVRGAAQICRRRRRHILSKGLAAAHARERCRRKGVLRPRSMRRRCVHSKARWPTKTWADGWHRPSVCGGVSEAR